MKHFKDDFVYYSDSDDVQKGVTSEVELDAEREKQGYDLLKEDTIKCADCRKTLIEVIKVKEDKNQQKIIDVYCPCGGSSFLYVIEGVTYLQAAKGLAIDDMPTEVKDGVTHMTIKVIKA